MATTAYTGKATVRRSISVPGGDGTMIQNEFSWNDLNAAEASEALQKYNKSASCRIKTKIKLSHPTDAGLSLDGQQIFRYDMNYNQINGLFYSPEKRTSMEISADIIIDKTSVEVFVDDGAFSYAQDT